MDKRVKKAYNIIRRSYQDKLLLDHLSSEVGLSKFHLQRLFKAEFNESPAECLLRTRIERAAHFLKLRTKISLSDLAEDCGFSSLSVFSRAFQKHYKVTPSAFLKQDDFTMTSIKEVKKVDVVYCPEIKVVYEATQLYHPQLSLQFNLAIERISKFGFQSEKRKIGIMHHLNVFSDHGRPNYFAGIEVTGNVPNEYEKDLFTIPSGKYACVFLTSPKKNIMQELIDLKYNWLDSSGYMVKNFLAWEEFLDEELVERKLYIPITPNK